MSHLQLTDLSASVAHMNRSDLRPELHMRTREVADRFGVSVQTVQRWMKQGHLTPVGRLGRAVGYVYSRAEVERLVKGQTDPVTDG